MSSKQVFQTGPVNNSSNNKIGFSSSDQVSVYLLSNQLCQEMSWKKKADYEPVALGGQKGRHLGDNSHKKWSLETKEILSEIPTRGWK